MSRVTSGDVEEIYNSTVSNASVTAATQIVDRILLDCDYTDDELFEIERWLAAHFQSSADGENAVTQIKQGERSKSRSAKFGLNLDASSYGQVAKQLDTCGKLADIGKRKATFDVL